MSDNITLPRRHIDYAAHALEHLIKNYNGSESFEVLVSEIIYHLRKALAAEPTKQEPVAWIDRFGSVVLGKGPYETFTTPLYTFPPDAPTVKESLTHPGYVIGSHWLETAYSRICAGEAEADVLRDCGWERVDQALRRDAERYRWLRNRACHGPHERFVVAEYGWFDVSGQHEPGFDAAIDAAMKEGKR